MCLYVCGGPLPGEALLHALLLLHAAHRVALHACPDIHLDLAVVLVVVAGEHHLRACWAHERGMRVVLVVQRLLEVPGWRAGGAACHGRRRARREGGGAMQQQPGRPC